VDEGWGQVVKWVGKGRVAVEGEMDEGGGQVVDFFVIFGMWKVADFLVKMISKCKMCNRGEDY